MKPPPYKDIETLTPLYRAPFAEQPSEAWKPLDQDMAECLLKDCLDAMGILNDDKCLIAEMRERGIWPYRRAMQEARDEA